MRRLRDRHLVGGAAAACAVCCAAPIIGLLGVAGFAATAVTLVFSGVVFAVLVVRRHHRRCWCVGNVRPARAAWCQRPARGPAAAREHKGLIWVGAGGIALGLYGFVATLQPDAHFGRILAAYGGVFVAGSLLWGVAMDGFRPDRYDIPGGLICLVGVAVMMYAPRTA